MQIVAPITRTYAAGDDLALEFTLTDADGDVLDVASLSAFRFELAANRDADPLASTEESPATATATPGSPTTNGKYTVTIAGTVTLALDGTYYFEAEAEDTSGNKATPARGYLTFIPTRI